MIRFYISIQLIPCGQNLDGIFVRRIKKLKKKKYQEKTIFELRRAEFQRTKEKHLLGPGMSLSHCVLKLVRFQTKLNF
jgi:hypothetical protein